MKYEKLCEEILSEDKLSKLQDKLADIIASQVQDIEHVEQMLSDIDSDDVKGFIKTILDMHSFSSSEEKQIAKLVKDIAKVS